MERKRSKEEYRPLKAEKTRVLAMLQAATTLASKGGVGNAGHTKPGQISTS